MPTCAVRAGRGNAAATSRAGRDDIAAATRMCRAARDAPHHGRGHLAGERALLLDRHVLAADGDPGALEELERPRRERHRREDDDLRRRRHGLDVGREEAQQRVGVRLGRRVELPCGENGSTVENESMPRPASNEFYR